MVFGREFELDSRGYRHAPLLQDLSGFTHAVTTRHGPAFGQIGTDAATAAAAEECALHLQMDGTAWAHQVHGSTVLQATEPGLQGQADALWTDTPGLLVAGRSADCPIVLVAGRRRTDDRPVAGFAHASWRSSVQRITARLLVAMDAHPESLRAAIAPSAGPCCYEVGPEVREAALEALGSQAEDFFVRPAGRLHFDLWAANRVQLEAGGVAPESIHVMGLCTLCQGEDFWSWRRQKEAAGRFAGLIGIRREG